jgi:hypothetical protein
MSITAEHLPLPPPRVRRGTAAMEISGSYAKSFFHKDMNQIIEDKI